MSLMTVTAAATDEPYDSRADGYLDGQIDALTALPEHYAEARASMADPHDPVYAQAYRDGYLHATALNAAYLERTETQGN